MREYTPQQREAIECRGTNVLVSAAAGSGKTAVLVERILRLVLEGQDVAGLMVVTFTNAAAAELRQRLQAALEERAAGDQRLMEQIARLPLAAISTLHAFCKRVLERYAQQAGLEAGFRVCEEAERELLRQAALEDTLDETYLDDALTARLTPLGTLEQVRQGLDALDRFLAGQPEPERWLAEALDAYAAQAQDIEGSAWQRELKALRVERLQEARRSAARLLKEVQEHAPVYAAVLATDLALINDLLSGSQAVSFARLPALRKEKKTEASERAAQKRKALQEEVRRAAAVGGPPTALQAEQLAAMEDPLRALAQVLLRFRRRFAAAKREAGVVDFDDLEQLTLLALADGRVCDALRARYDHIFVDEYQDSSAVQEEILRRICRADNRFLVGDVKQSIYRFRQAEPSLFIGHYGRFAQGEGGRLAVLNRNFRSQPGILLAVNRVFSRCMRASSAEIEYDADAALIPGLAGPVEAVTLSLVECRGGEDEEAEEERTVLEARQIASLIKRLHGSPIRVKGEERQACYRDIVVLLRSPKGFVRPLMDCLTQAGIPAYADAGGGFYETLEVRAALDYLTALDNPLKDVPLLGALRTVGGCAPEELAKIRLGKQGLSVWACVKLYAGKGENRALAARLASFSHQLWSLRLRGRRISVSRLVEAVLEETGLFAFCAGLPHGRRRMANLRTLPARAAAFDRPGLSLVDFLRFVQGSLPYARDGEAPLLTEQDDVVRVMSVHKAKGLEFPIVIGAGLGRCFNHRPNGAVRSGAGLPLLLHRRLGLGVQYLNAELRMKAETLAQTAIRARMLRETDAEEMRILYVLMTRACSRLALEGAVDSAAEACGRWAQGAQALCPLDWIGPALYTHPDGAPLRELAQDGPDTAVEGDASRWQVEVVPARQLTQGAEAAPAAASYRTLLQQLPPADPQLLEALGPYRGPSQLRPQKQSVTERLRQSESIQFIHTRPAFLREQRRLTGSEAGTAVHRVMSGLDLAPLRGLAGPALEAEIGRQIGQMQRRELIEPRQAEAAQAAPLARFFAGELGQSMLASPRVLREHPFVLRIPQEDVLLQGVIDLCFLTASGWTLVDYKTDRRNLSPDQVRARHGEQVGLYAMAMRASGLTVCKACVYLFATGAIVAMDLESAQAAP